MKITINGIVKSDAMDKFLDEAEVKKNKIIQYCEKKNEKELHWKDSEFEFEYKQEFTKPKPKIETRAKGG